jgi:hypothetical protein
MALLLFVACIREMHAIYDQTFLPMQCIGYCKYCIVHKVLKENKYLKDKKISRLGLNYVQYSTVRCFFNHHNVTLSP